MKQQVVAAARAATLYVSDRMLKKSKNDVDGPGTDVADAYWLADMLRTEQSVRRGTTLVSSLEPRRIEVFNAVSDASPVNVLARPMVSFDP